MPAYHPAEIHPLYRAAFNAGDLECLTALYEPSAVLVVDGVPLHGRNNIREAFKRILVRRGRMTLETCSVVETHEGLALLHARWIVQYPNDMGGTLVTRGLSTEVVRKQPDGTWLFVVDTPYTPE
jgi:uncharacterized protein (TIGR02246 family)